MADPTSASTLRSSARLATKEGENMEAEDSQPDAHQSWKRGQQKGQAVPEEEEGMGESEESQDLLAVPVPGIMPAPLEEAATVPSSFCSQHSCDSIVFTSSPPAVAATYRKCSSSSAKMGALAINTSTSSSASLTTSLSVSSSTHQQQAVQRDKGKTKSKAKNATTMGGYGHLELVSRRSSTLAAAGVSPTAQPEDDDVTVGCEGGDYEGGGAEAMEVEEGDTHKLGKSCRTGIESKRKVQ